jgi:DNA-binding IclR family transcriptional regulator
MSVAATNPIPATAVGVLDRSVAVLDAVERGARSFTDIVEATGLTRPTVHRLIKALETHGLLGAQDGYHLGPKLLRFAAGAMRDLPLRDLAHPLLERLSLTTGESAQLYVRNGSKRVCVDSVESSSELRTIVAVGAELPISAGSAGKVFLALGSQLLKQDVLSRAEKLTERTPVGPALERQLANIRRLGYATSSGEREPGVGSVSAPVLNHDGELLAVVSVSGPESRLGRSPGRRYAPAVIGAARDIELAVGAGR